MVPTEETRDHGHKLKHRGFPLNIRRHFVSARETEPRHRLPREMANSQEPSGCGLGKPVLADPAFSQGWDQMYSRDPFQPHHPEIL